MSDVHGHEGNELLDAGFRIWHDRDERLSAWIRPIDDTGWTIVITDSTGLSHKREMGDGFNDCWLVSPVYDAGGETFREPVQCKTVTEALDEAERLHRQIVAEVTSYFSGFIDPPSPFASPEEIQEFIDELKALPESSIRDRYLAEAEENLRWRRELDREKSK
jgi:hypothetical protein